MPLIQGKSQEAFGKNVGKEMDAGKPRAQSLAIAYNMKRRMAQKKAKGGMIRDKEVNRMDEKPEMYAQGGMTSGDRYTEADKAKYISKRDGRYTEAGAMANGGVARSDSEMDIRKNQIANAFKAKGGMMQKYAKGGMVENEDLDPTYEPEHSAEDKVYGQMDYGFKAQNYEDLPEPREPKDSYMEDMEDTPRGMLGNIAESIMKSRISKTDNYPRMMAEGGLVEYPGKDYVATSSIPSRGMGKTEITNLGHDEDMDQNADFLSDEEQDPFAHHNDFDEFAIKPKRRSILDSIMRGR